MFALMTEKLTKYENKFRIWGEQKIQKWKNYLVRLDLLPTCNIDCIPRYYSYPDIFWQIKQVSI